MLCMAADWVHLKLLLYAIGSGNIGKDNVKHLHGQWRAHLRSFGAPLGSTLLLPTACPLPSIGKTIWERQWMKRSMDLSSMGYSCARALPPYGL